ncbi:MAG: hypothetical protein SGJ11_14175 [Phycisphaerae bacterium]|nr:hypothetical protein [Phycisphaerae bacterium]
MNGAQEPQQADEWSAGDEALHFSAVFLLFAPVGVMLMMVFKTPQGWAAGLASAAFLCA